MKRKLLILAIVGAGAVVACKKRDAIIDFVDEVAERRRTIVHERVTDLRKKTSSDVNEYNFDTDHEQ